MGREKRDGEFILVHRELFVAFLFETFIILLGCFPCVKVALFRENSKKVFDNYDIDI